MLFRSRIFSLCSISELETCIPGHCRGVVANLGAASLLESGAHRRRARHERLVDVDHHSNSRGAGEELGQRRRAGIGAAAGGRSPPYLAAAPQLRRRSCASRSAPQAVSAPPPCAAGRGKRPAAVD